MMKGRMKAIREASKELTHNQQYKDEKLEYERVSLIIFSRIVSGFGFGYSVAITLMQYLGKLPQDYSGGFLLIFAVFSLVFSVYTKHALTPQRLNRVQYYIAAYGAYSVLVTYLLSQVYESVSIFLFSLIILCTSRVWAHPRKYFVFIVLVTTAVISIYVSLAQPEKFTWLYIFDYVIIALFAIGLNIVHVEEHFHMFSLKCQLEKERDTDALTGLENRKLLNRQFMQSTSCSDRLGIVMVDVDNFKSINDTFGHKAGDKVLVYIAELLKEAFRDIDYIARVGGDEFAVLIPLYKEKQRVLETRCAALLSKVPVKVTGKSDAVFVTLSVGTYSREVDESISLDYMLNKADKALYESKKAGRNRATFYHQNSPSQTLCVNGDTDAQDVILIN